MQASYLILLKNTRSCSVLAYIFLMPKELTARISTRKFAQLYGVHLNTVYYWIRAGVLPIPRKIQKAILIDPVEAEAALSKFDLNTEKAAH